MDSSKLTRAEILELTQKATGLRASPRLTVCAEILWIMSVCPPFQRRDVRAMLRKGGYAGSCVDRALRELEVAGLVEVSELRGPGRGGGHIYRIMTLEAVPDSRPGAGGGRVQKISRP